MSGSAGHRGIRTRVGTSFQASVGDIVFGMEDGAVSIFGLVFGVAAGGSDSHAVVLAGATGAVAAAVSMMAGAFLDTQSVRDKARSEIEAKRVVTALTREPGAVLEYEEAIELRLGDTAHQDPRAHAAWMFASDVIAASIPVIPFIFLPIDQARVVSFVITTALLVLLGIGRGVIARRSVAITTLQTLAVGGAAALAGVAIGRLVGGG